MMRPSCRLAAVSMLLGLVAAGAALPDVQPPLALDRGATGLGLALRRVGTAGRVLYVTAHPDDEHNGVLVRLSRGLGVRTGLFTMTRGEGGQNQIGPELGEALGVLRTAELLASHRYDAVEQSFGRAYEFGYSFSVDETLDRWGREESLSDVVRVLRAFRPDAVLTLPVDGEGGGQHHQAVGRLAREAFRAAADPARFPDQSRDGLRPWQAARLYAGGVGGGSEPVPSGPRLALQTGLYDPLLGLTWQQLGARARAMHRSQTLPQTPVSPGPAQAEYALLDSAGGPTPRTDVLTEDEMRLAGLARFAPEAVSLPAALARIEASAVAARAFDAAHPEEALAPLVATWTALRDLRRTLPGLVADAAARSELDDRLEEEEQDLERALSLAQGLEAEVRADAGLVTPGETFPVSVSVWNHGSAAVEIEQATFDLDEGWRAGGDPVLGPVPGSGGRSWRVPVSVPADARVSQPFWTRMPGRDRHAVRDGVEPVLPWSPPEVVARLRCRVAGASVTLRVPAVFRYEAGFSGEKSHPVQVVPELSVRVSPETVACPVGTPRPFRVRVFVRSLRGTGEADVRLEVPSGFTLRPSHASLPLSYEGEEAGIEFEVRPPRALSPGLRSLPALVRRRGREYRQELQVVEYPHVERRQLLRASSLRLLALDVRTRGGIHVGYVRGAGDAVGDAVRGLGVPVTQLTAEDLAFSDLARYTTIVTGIRAYETRPDLRAAHGRLMRYVEDGGHLVVQYNRASFNGAARSGAPAASPFVPFPAVVTSERISDEDAPVRRLVASHPLLDSPNRIDAQDWRGWVQERGIQLLEARDRRYVELLASADPFPYNPGEKRGLLVDAQVGRGTWTYVGLALFRQLPADVPGGWRLLANLISRPRASSPRSATTGQLRDTRP